MTTTETVVVKLMVAADGALRALDQFDDNMTQAANASVKGSQAADALTKHIERMRRAQEAGIPVMKARTAQMDIEQKMLNSVLGRTDAVARARINAERDIARAVASTSNLVIQGKMDEATALRTVTAVEQSHVNQINRMIAAQRQAADSAQANAIAVGNSARSLQQYNLSASRNSFESANIAMQFQDIAVSAQMGMSPMMVALQQGTQLSAIFNQMKNPLQALPTAFLSIINPVSLLTIAMVGLSTVAIQWGMSLFEAAEDADTALEKHGKLLDSLLEGYGNIRDGAQAALDVMLKLPEGVVAADLMNSLDEQERLAKSATERYEQVRAGIQSLNEDLTELRDTFAAVGEEAGADIYLKQLDDLAKLQITATSTVPELKAIMEASKELHRATDDDGIKQLANDLYAAASEAWTLQAIAQNLSTTLKNIPTDIRIRISMSEVFSGAMSDIRGLYMDPRDRFTQAREELKLRAQAAQDAAQTTSELMTLANEYQRVMASIDAAEAKANEKANSKAAKDAAKPFDTWAGNVEDFQRRIAAQELEIALVGQSTFEIERQKAAFDLLNQAKQAGVVITPQLTAQIDMMTHAYAQSSVELQRLQYQQQQIEQINSALAVGFADALEGEDVATFLCEVTDAMAA